MIIAHLAYDTPSLLACTLVCYSWYIAAVPHLYNTIPIGACSCFRNSKWPNPLPRMHTLGLLPLVNVLAVKGTYDNDAGLSPKMFNRHTLRQFRALTNLQELWIDYLDIPKFMPRAQRYFGHFLPTLQSLGLGEPRGSNRQIIYFIGLFQHLQTFKLANHKGDIRGEFADDLTLIPPFAPPLRRWLIMKSVTEVGLLKDMIDLFGGIRFRYMDLFGVLGMRLLLDACAETLETLMLYPSDQYGEKHCSNCVYAIANDFVAMSSLHDFDLSRNKSFRRLELLASFIGHTPPAGSPDTPTFLKHVLSTITSSVPTDVVIQYLDEDFCGVEWRRPGWPLLRELSQAEREKEASQYRMQFEVLREVRKVRDFRLVLCAMVWGCVGEYPVQVLEKAVEDERVNGGFDDFSRQPLVENDPSRICAECDMYYRVRRGRSHWTFFCYS